MFRASLGDKVESVALTGDGKVLIAGTFSAVGGQSRANFARLSNDTAALQDLTVTRTASIMDAGWRQPAALAGRVPVIERQLELHYH